ncbi:hypothetical protein [Agarivorans sp. DSG3-1]|uniref:hypothetical protein n=1 Tax=Agarivorans sp. DSG3-1 TaxID=3342249 RepID=UPI00398E48ED
MSDKELSIKDILSSLTPTQFYAISAACVAIIVGTYIFGSFVQKTQSDGLLNDKDNIIRENSFRHMQETDALIRKINDLENKKASLEETLAFEAELIRALDSKSRFLSQYITYLSNPSDQSKKIFVDLVCGMWREDQKNRVSFRREQLNLTANDLIRGVDSETKQVLIKQGVPMHLVERVNSLRTQPFLKTNQPVDRELERIERTLQRSLEGTKLVKIISFSNTESYVLPDEISKAVHLQSNCAP